jgi:hypothetical protein
MNAEGRYQVGLDAIQLDNIANPSTLFLPVGGN